MNKETRTIEISLMPEIWQRLEEEIIGLPEFLRRKSVPQAVALLIEKYYEDFDWEMALDRN